MLGQGWAPEAEAFWAPGEPERVDLLTSFKLLSVPGSVQVDIIGVVQLFIFSAKEAICFI